jgi:hypothetical protein
MQSGLTTTYLGFLQRCFQREKRPVERSRESDQRRFARGPAQARIEHSIEPHLGCSERVDAALALERCLKAAQQGSAA